MRRSKSPPEDVNLIKRHLHEVSAEKDKLHEENRSLKIRVAGVETLSNLLQKSQEENASLRAELSVSKPKNRFVQPPPTTRSKTCNSVEYGHSSPSVENMAKGNIRSRRELESTKPEKRSGRLHSLHDIKHTSTGKYSNTMSQLMEFKNEVVDELRRLQQSEETVQKSDLLVMTAQLMDEVKLLEESVQSEECLDLKPQGKSENEKQNSEPRDLSENVRGLEKYHHVKKRDNTGCVTLNASLQHLTRTHCDDTTDKRKILIPPQAVLEKRTTMSETSESVALLSESGEETGIEWSGEFIGENVGLAQGDESSVAKSDCENVSENGQSQELKLTRQLLMEAKEKITKLTSANGVLTDMNVKWQEYNDQRDAFVRHLENQLCQAAEQANSLQRSQENKHAISTWRDSPMQDQAELRHKLEVESQARTRAETTVRHLTNRLSDMMQQLEQEKVKVSGLEEVVQQMTNWRNEETDDKERIKVLEEQIIICKEDFERERADRERLHHEKENAQVGLLQMEDKVGVLEYQNLAYQRELEQVHSQMAVYHLKARPSVRQLGNQLGGRLSYGSSPCLYAEGRRRPMAGVLPRGTTNLPHDVEIDGDVIDGPAGSAGNREVSSKQRAVQEDSVDRAGLRDNFQSFASTDFRKEKEPASI